MQIFLGILITAIGAIFVIKTEWFLENFGRLDWFEQKLGTEGGSRLGYKIILVLLFYLLVLS